MKPRANSRADDCAGLVVTARTEEREIQTNNATQTMPQGGGWWNRYVGLAGGILLITASGGVYGFGAIAAKQC